MIIKHANHGDYVDLMGTRSDLHRAVSLILPARGEHTTIGAYFPVLAPLLEKGHIDEVIVADSSDDMRTIDAALNAAMQIPVFENKMRRALTGDGPFPLKAVSVFDSEFDPIFPNLTLNRGNAPGKGTAMYLGMAVASGDILVFLDSDFENIGPRFMYGLIGPFSDPNVVLSKATFEIEDIYGGVVQSCIERGDDPSRCDLLMKSVNSRTLARPAMRLVEQFGLYPGISQFNGPLSGGCGASRDLWHELNVPTKYGIEVSYLMQIMKGHPNGAVSIDVNLGEVVQESQDPNGRVRMAGNIISALLHHISEEKPDLYQAFVSDPTLLANEYKRLAEPFIVHGSDSHRVELYAGMLESIVEKGDLTSELTVLPPLNQNLWYRRNSQRVVARAIDATKEELGYLGYQDRIESSFPEGDKTGVLSSQLVQPMSNSI